LTVSEFASEIVEFLLQNGAKVSERNSDGSTPLYIAAQEGHNDVVMVH
jgi:ankyrin repeat protein